MLSACSAAVVLHLLDERLWHPHSGVPVSAHLGEHLFSIAVMLVAVVTLVRWPIWLPPWLRYLVALGVGAVAAASGAMHMLHATRESPSGADASGMLAGIAGVVLVLMAFIGPLRHPRRPWRSIGARVGRIALTLVWGVVSALVLAPAVLGVIATHAPVLREAKFLLPGSREVSFRASDGFLLRGTYVSSRNGACVILVSSARGDRSAVLPHARMLVSHGYGVLAYDARGSGASQGDPNSYGWGWVDDIQGAVTYVQQRPDVAAGRVGILGLSTGADAALAAASGDGRIRAVVADGATGRAAPDVVPQLSADPTGWIYAHALFASVWFWSGATPGAPLVDLVPRISPVPVLLIATGSLPVELPANRRYADAAREPVTLWELPSVDHTAAIQQIPTEYRDTVTQFLDQALIPSRQGLVHAGVD
jgi:dienelactone hydrolase